MAHLRTAKYAVLVLAVLGLVAFGGVVAAGGSSDSPVMAAYAAPVPTDIATTTTVAPTTTTTTVAPTTSVAPTTVPAPVATTVSVTTVPVTITPATIQTALVPPLAGVWACIRQHESDGNYGEDDGNGYHGAYQFLQSTWDAVAKHLGLTQYVGVDPAQAPPSVQDEFAVALQELGGWGQWSTSAECGA